MKTNEQILEKAAESASQILKIPHHNIDKTKFVYFYTLLFCAMERDSNWDFIKNQIDTCGVDGHHWESK